LGRLIGWFRSKSNEKAKAVAKRNQYADLVKERFKPKVNLAKRLELQARKVRVSNNSLRCCGLIRSARAGALSLSVGSP
jgi:hypothetical protein